MEDVKGTPHVLTIHLADARILIEKSQSPLERFVARNLPRLVVRGVVFYVNVPRRVLSRIKKGRACNNRAFLVRWWVMALKVPWVVFTPCRYV